MLWKKTIIPVVEISSQCQKHGCAIQTFTNLSQHLEILVNFGVVFFYWSTHLAAQSTSLANPPLFATCTSPEQRIVWVLGEIPCPSAWMRDVCSWLASTLNVKLSSDVTEDGKQLLSFRAQM